jgi:hypothetical protein
MQRKLSKLDVELDLIDKSVDHPSHNHVAGSAKSPCIYTRNYLGFRVSQSHIFCATNSSPRECIRGPSC